MRQIRPSLQILSLFPSMLADCKSVYTGSIPVLASSVQIEIFDLSQHTLTPIRPVRYQLPLRARRRFVFPPLFVVPSIRGYQSSSTLHWNNDCYQTSYMRAWFTRRPIKLASWCLHDILAAISLRRVLDGPGCFLCKPAAFPHRRGNHALCHGRSVRHL